MMPLRRTTMILLVILGLAMIHLWLHVQIINLSFDIAPLKKELGSLQEENMLLKSVVARLEALPRIEKIAKEKLNMLWPGKIIYIKGK